MKFLHRILIFAAAPAAHAWSPGQEPPEMPPGTFSLPEGLEITSWAAVPSLKTRAAVANLSAEQRKLAVDSTTFIKPKVSEDALMDHAEEGAPVRWRALWWLKNRSEGEWSSPGLTDELEKRKLIEKPVPLVEVIVPLKPESTKFSVAHGDPVVIRSTGGVTQRVPKSRIGSCKNMDRSLMLGADLLGMSAQDVTDVVEWMKTY